MNRRSPMQSYTIVDRAPIRDGCHRALVQYPLSQVVRDGYCPLHCPIESGRRCLGHYESLVATTFLRFPLYISVPLNLGPTPKG